MKDNQKATPRRCRSTATATATAIAAMLAASACPAQAFQPSALLLAPIQHSLHGNPHYCHPLSALSMRGDCSSPWDWDADMRGMQPFRRRRRGGRLMRRGGPTIISPLYPFVDFQDSPPTDLHVGEPEITDTKEDYTMTFRVPADVDEENGLDVSITDRLMTVRAKATREDTPEPDRGGRVGGGGWFSRSSRTDTVCRSFVIPEGVSTAGVTTSRTTAEGGDGEKLQVRFKKLSDGDAINTTAASTTATEVSKVSDGDGKQQVGSSPTEVPEATTAGPESTDSANAAPAPEALPGPRSVFDAVNQEFGEFARLMWGEENVPPFPTDEEMAARVKAAREARTRRVMSWRRATMVVDVSDTGGVYVIKVALPEGAKRDNVKLTVSPDDILRVSFAAEGQRSVSKDVRLPRDALVAQVSAKFQAESDGDVTAEEGGGVSALEITVAKSVPPEPKTIEIA